MFDTPATGEAIFFNYTDRPFTWSWDGQPRTFEPGARVNLTAAKARHYAVHLTNRELCYEARNGGNPMLESYTSPEKPEDVIEFMERFNKCFIPLGQKENGAIDAAERDRLELLELRSTIQNEPQTKESVKRDDFADDEDDFEDEPSVPVVEEKEPTPEEVEKAALQQEAKALKVPGWHLLGVENLKKQIELKKAKDT